MFVLFRIIVSAFGVTQLLSYTWTIHLIVVIHRIISLDCNLNFNNQINTHFINYQSNQYEIIHGSVYRSRKHMEWFSCDTFYFCPVFYCYRICLVLCTYFLEATFVFCLRCCNSPWFQRCQWIWKYKSYIIFIHIKLNNIVAIKI